MCLIAVKLLSDSVQAPIHRLKHVIQQNKPAQRLKGERDHCPSVSSIPMSTPMVRIAPVTAIQVIATSHLSEDKPAVVIVDTGAASQETLHPRCGKKRAGFSGSQGRLSLLHLSFTEGERVLGQEGQFPVEASMHRRARP